MKKLFVLLAFLLAILSLGIILSMNSGNVEVEELHESNKELKFKETPRLAEANSKVLMAYIQDFRDPGMVDYSMVTHVIFSFAHPTKEGTLMFNGETAMNNLRTMVSKAHEQNTKAILAVGGWYHIEGGESYEYFKVAISNPNTRTKLVRELVHVAKQEKLDGIDIDFEHPRSDEDAHNLAVFTEMLSDEIHAINKELSIAVYSKINSVTGTEMNYVVFDTTMFQHVDHVNIMAYDGQWDGGYNAANLSPYPFTKKIVDYWSKLFDSNGISKKKLVLGVPFYAQPENQASKQVSYAAIVDNNPKNATRDTVHMHGTTYHYNGTLTMQRKTKLALDNGFGGMMLWEAGHDAQGKYSLALAISNELQKPGNEQEKQYTLNTQDKK
ncbi:glycoside hydrolase family 18 protein [Bacillus sp. V5-8f]|uniref:glycoside hydrolase family 18 protein n=1 Tax=Bacillus sp. V5-8f TaxID=2053044 RepID=UPI000C7861E4|nr:glycoside hydrolase family 18 protein [Bacillus sp. V5-8f]PLT35609.1 chitinase [Bacillus sp. V5-8f]